VIEPKVPKLPPYVLSLVVVAAGGENKSARERPLFARNAALRYALEYAGAMPSIGSDPSSNPMMRRWLDDDAPPSDLFELTARLLDGVDMRVRGRHKTLPKGDDDVATVFDHAALLALAQVVQSAGGMRSAADSAASDAFRRLSARSPRDLQQLLIENYLGNILHDFFDACEVRAEFPRLPVDTEHDLRVKHGRAIAQAIFESLPPANPLPPESVQEALRSMVGLIWIEESKLDDQNHRQESH
jgi:hypothetical protein